MKSEGFRRVPTERLQRLLRIIHKEQIEFPVTRAGLIAAAMGDFEEHLGLIVGMDKRAAQNIVVAVLAERRVSALK